MIYFVVLIVLLLLVFHFDAKGRVQSDNSFYWGIMVVFIFLLGVRYKVGGDTLAYMEYYKALLSIEKTDLAYWQQAKNEFGFGYLWMFFCSTCKFFTNSFVLFQFVHAFIVNYIIFQFIKKNTKYIFTGVLLYYLFYFLPFNTEILRQALAIVVFLLSIDAFFNKQWVKYYVFVLVAAQFHTSAYVLAFFPFTFLFNKIRISLFVSGILVLSLIVPFVQDAFLQIITYYVKSDYLLDKITRTTLMEFNLNGIIFTLSTKVFLPLGLIMIYEQIFKVKTKYKPMLYCYVTFSVLTVYMPIFSRLTEYLTPIYYIWLVDFLIEIRRSSFFKVISKVAVFVFLLISLLPVGYYYYRDTSDKVENTRFYYLWYPYRSIFNKKEDSIREEIVYRHNYYKKYQEKNTD